MRRAQGIPPEIIPLKTTKTPTLLSIFLALWSLHIQAQDSPSQSSTAQSVKADLKPDAVTVRVGGKLFTEYLFLADSKYPYFYPLNGPNTGQSITARKTEPYPHHSSLFFGCDRVNGGNYWQEGLERGRIVSKDVRLLQSGGDRVIFEQDCQWERPGAEAPFRDHRKVTISAPSTDLRFIDFDITLTAQLEVRIEKNNHSLFSARVAPELSVSGGGTLINAHGDQNEKGTFGQPAPWADYSGTRAGQTEGLAIFFHPANPWFPPPWFTRDYGFFSPTPMFWLEKGFWELPKGQTLHLRYRVIVHGGGLTPSQLETLFQTWSKE